MADYFVSYQQVVFDLIKKLLFELLKTKFCSRSAEKFGIISDNFWEHLWNKIIDACGEDEQNFVVYTTTLYSAMAYWCITSGFFLLNFIPYCQKFKNQPEKNLDWKKVAKVSLRFSFYRGRRKIF